MTLNSHTNLLWYKEPASDWMTEALPIGNGRMGAMVFGTLEQERFQFNEISLWTGDESDTGAYQNFGDVFIELGHDGAEEYRRQLDIAAGVHSVSYRREGVRYHRESFVSAEHQTLIIRMTADRTGSFTGRLSLVDAHEAVTKSSIDSLAFSGALDNGLQYEAVITLLSESGHTEPDGNSLRFSDADSLTIILTCGTDYLPERSKFWRGEHPHSVVASQNERARTISYPDLREAHVRNYKALFDRVSLNLGETPMAVQALPTNERLAAYTAGGDDPLLEALLFNYGRYLLISSSRPGSLPANLQGIWNNSNNPPWRCDYHSNINVQMNYWPAETTNLSECHLPFLNYIESLRDVRTEATKAKYGVRGWTVQTENGVFGGSTFKWNTPGSAWYCQHLWEHYSFGRDKVYLQEFAYPLLREVCEFWLDRLAANEDGYLVAPDGWSPEHGPEEDGVSFDQQIIWDLFKNTIETLDILGIDEAFQEELTAAKLRLLRPKIGRWGQIQEWMEDKDDPECHHRHVSQLFGLHPGRQISVANTPELAEAARVTLNARGDESTGWSKAWKINFWARLRDGDRAYSLLRNQLRLVTQTTFDYDGGGGTYRNMLDAHPPFQIDGNFGVTAGIAEMLLQSDQGIIDLLPALPKAWQSGYCFGLRARGGFEIDITWNDCKFVRGVVKSLIGGNCTVKSQVVITDGATTGTCIEFETVPGEFYLITSLA